MLAEIVAITSGVMQARQAKQNLKTAKINRQMMVATALNKGLTTMGSNQEVKDFMKEYKNVSKQLKEDSLWI